MASSNPGVPEENLQEKIVDGFDSLPMEMLMKIIRDLTMENIHNLITAKPTPAMKAAVFKYLR